MFTYSCSSMMLAVSLVAHAQLSIGYLAYRAAVMQLHQNRQTQCLKAFLLGLLSTATAADPYLHDSRSVFLSRTPSWKSWRLHQQVKTSWKSWQLRQQANKVQQLYLGFILGGPGTAINADSNVLQQPPHIPLVLPPPAVTTYINTYTYLTLS